MNTDTKHALLNLREEVNAEQDEEILKAKQDYLEVVSNNRQVMKDAISSIKATYRQLYTLKKAELIAENEV